MEKVFTYLSWLVLITLVLAIVRQLSERRSIYFLPDSWGRFYANYGQQGYENFADTPGSLANVKGIVEKTDLATSGNPNEANAPTSFTPLSDVLKTKGTDGELTAGTCFQKDFLAQTEKVGNYIQRTNNFRHGTPDNCSAPRTELVDAIYANPTLAS
jgi:hypothetical protein